PASMIFEEYKQEFYPKETKNNEHLSRITRQIDRMDADNTVLYVDFSEPFLQQKAEKWQEGKAIAKTNLYQLVIFLAGFILSFSYLVLVVGRTSFSDKELRFRPVEKLYNDVNLVICILLFPLWIVLVDDVFENMFNMFTIITIPMASVALLLILLLVKHVKNR